MIVNAEYGIIQHTRGKKEMEIKRDEIEKLIPSNINFNYTELKEEIDAKLEQYKNKSSTSEENYKERKADRAKLNALAKSLAQEKTNVRNILLAPLNSKGNDTYSFGEKIDLLIGSIKEVVSEIDNGIKEYEEARRQVKSGVIMEYLSEKVRTSFRTVQEAIDSKHWENWANAQMLRNRNAWLNETMPLNAINKEIDEEVDRCVAAYQSMIMLFSNDGELTFVRAKNTLLIDFDVEKMSTAVLNHKREMAEIEKRKEAEKQIEEQKLMKEVKVPKEQKKETMFKYTITFVGTRDAISNLRQYLEINEGLSYKIIERKALA